MSAIDVPGLIWMGSPVVDQRTDHIDCCVEGNGVTVWILVCLAICQHVPRADAVSNRRIDQVLAGIASLFEQRDHRTGSVGHETDQLTGFTLEPGLVHA